MSKAEAVKKILKHLEFGGLPRAIEIYNYLGCFGELEVTTEMVDGYFNR